MALPSVRDSQVAEAWGAHLAMALVLRLRHGGRRVRIFGDNLGVVMFFFLRSAGSPPSGVCPGGPGARAHSAGLGGVAGVLACGEKEA